MSGCDRHNKGNKRKEVFDRNVKFVLLMLYPDSGIPMDEEIVLGDMIWSYNKAEL